MKRKLLLFITILYFANLSHAQWTSQTSGTSEHLREVSFIDANNGWVCGNAGVIRNTTNGGSSWSAQPSGIASTLHAITFVDANNGWACGNGGIIRNTTNGGSSWSAQTSGVPGTLNDVFFVDANNGWICGNGGVIRNTTNGGSTWSGQTSATGSDLRAAFFIDSSTGWIVANSGRVQVTTNGGSTWSLQTSSTAENLVSVTFVDANTGWASGANGTIIHTTNGGSTWSTQTSGVTTGLHDIFFVDANNGWAVANDGTIITTCDGGSTWTTQVSGTVEVMVGCNFPDGNNGWAVGFAGTILKLEDRVLDFDGTDDYVEIPFNAAFNANKVTIEAWVKPETTTQTWSRIFSSNDNEFELTQRSNGEDKFGAYTTDGGLKSVVNSSTWTAGQWYHVAMVMDGTNMHLYVDGSLIGSVAAATGSSNNNRYIGSKSTTANHYFKGQIDELRYWNTALSAADISNLYNKIVVDPTLLSSCIVAYYKMDETSGTSLPDESGNGHTGTLTNMAGTEWTASTNSLTSQNYANCGAALTCTDPSAMAANNITSSAADLTWTENGNACNWDLEWKAGSDFTPGTGAEDGSAAVMTTPSYSMSSLTPGTMYYVYYRADCGGYNSNWVGAYTFTTSVPTTVLGECNGLDFDGTDDYFTIPDDDAFDFASGGTFTIELWIYWRGDHSSSPQSQVIIDKTESNNTNWRFGVVESTNGQSPSELFFFNNAGNIWSTTTIPTNTWTHVALVHNNGTASYYINGVAANSGSHSPGAVNNGAVYVGLSNQVGHDTYFNGIMDELRIWSTARTVTEILASYRGELCGNESNLILYSDFNQGTAGGDNSGITTVDDKTSNSNDGTLVNFAKTGSTSNFISSAAIQKNGLDFDGTDDYFTIPDDNAFDFTSGGTFTIELWIYWRGDHSSSPQSQVIIDKTESNNTNWRFGVVESTNGQSPSELFFFNNSGNIWSTTTIPTNTWTHVALVHNNGTASYYINGVAANSGSHSPGAVNNGAVYVGLSNQVGHDTYFNGTMDELRIWSTARSAGEISGNMNSIITGTTTDLIAYYKFNQGDADGTNTNVTTAVDLSNNCFHGTLNGFGLSGSTSNWASGASALPVELTYFRGQAVEESSLLTWETATETNNEGFEIQWASSSEQMVPIAIGSSWQSIGFVKGAGDSFETRTYQFVHKNPVKGVNYYRLKQIDYDGNFEYSNVVSVDFSVVGSRLSVVPNPVQSGEFTLYLPENEAESIPLEIYDYTGKLIQQQTLYENQSSIDVDQLLPGIYLVRVAIDGRSLVERVVIR